MTVPPTLRHGHRKGLGSARSGQNSERLAAARGSQARAETEPLATSDFYFLSAICLTACLALWLTQFFGTQQMFLRFFPGPLAGQSSYLALESKAWWAVCIVVGYVVLPAMLLAAWPGKNLGDCFLSFAGLRENFRLYAGIYAVALPAVWLASGTSTFLSFYPMYSLAGRSWFDLLAWESLYAVQFIALEFFFRGFLLAELGSRMGALAIPVTLMPYMMVHFGKPPLEVAASVGAGLILGWLAWKTRSIWGGLCLHFGLALGMDLFALAHKGQLL